MDNPPVKKKRGRPPKLGPNGERLLPRRRTGRLSRKDPPSSVLLEAMASAGFKDGRLPKRDEPVTVVDGVLQTSDRHVVPSGSRYKNISDQKRRKDAIAQLWRAGCLIWKLRPHQIPLYEAIAASPHRRLVINVARQFGKTFTVCLYAVEFALQHPGAQIRFAAPNRLQLRSAVLPNLETILTDCPKDMRPEFKTQLNMYQFKNGSELHLAGADSGHCESLRGQVSHLNCVDEAGFVDDLDYLLKSVLFPQTLTTGGRTIVISTPPRSPAHPFVTLARKAEAEGAYICRTIDDDTFLSAEQKAAAIANAGGVDTVDYKREHLCQFVIDQNFAVVPEFTEEAEKAIVSEPAPPLYENRLVAMDVGWKDATHILFGYYDFRNARLCIQDEIMMTRMRTDELAAAVKEKEAELWPGQKPFIRVSDVNLILLNDLSKIHGLHFQQTSKDFLEAMVNELRLWVQSRRLQISPKCRHLITQLKSAIWNNRRTEFARTDGHHFDAVAALIYGVRNCPVDSNPYPSIPEGISHHTHFISPAMGQKQPEAAGAIMSMFSRRRA